MAKKKGDDNKKKSDVETRDVRPFVDRFLLVFMQVILLFAMTVFPALIAVLMYAIDIQVKDNAQGLTMAEADTLRKRARLIGGLFIFAAGAIVLRAFFRVFWDGRIGQNDPETDKRYADEIYIGKWNLWVILRILAIGAAFGLVIAGHMTLVSDYTQNSLFATHPASQGLRFSARAFSWLALLVVTIGGGIEIVREMFGQPKFLVKSNRPSPLYVITREELKEMEDSKEDADVHAHLLDEHMFNDQVMESGGAPASSPAAHRHDLNVDCLKNKLRPPQRLEGVRR